jgi:hypothetical protein
VVVKLINTDGLLIFGQGSEWFWSMAQFVVVVVTLFGIYRQLVIARSANAFAQANEISKEWTSERTTRHALEVYLALRDGVSPENVPYGAATIVGDFWENVGALVRAGHLNRSIVYDVLGNGPRWWWAALSPLARRGRVEAGDPAIYEHFEWLADVMAEMDRKAGLSVPYDEAYLASTLDRKIEMARDRIRLAEELRAVIVRPMTPSTSPAPPPIAQDTVATADTPA